MGAPKGSPFRIAESLRGKIFGGARNKEAEAREARNAQQREAGRASANLAGDVAGSTFLGVRQKLKLINELQRAEGRRVETGDLAKLSDEELAPRLAEAQRNIRDPFFAVAGGSGAFSSVQERFRAMVEEEKKTRAAFQKEKAIRLDQPGQKQLLGGSTSSVGMSGGSGGSGASRSLLG